MNSRHGLFHFIEGHVNKINKALLWWQHTHSAQHIATPPYSQSTQYFVCGEVVVENGDIVAADDFAVYEHAPSSTVWIVRLLEILCNAQGATNEAQFILVEGFRSGDLVGPYNMPQLISTNQYHMVIPQVSTC